MLCAWMQVLNLLLNIPVAMCIQRVLPFVVITWNWHKIKVCSTSKKRQHTWKLASFSPKKNLKRKLACVESYCIKRFNLISARFAWIWRWLYAFALQTNATQMKLYSHWCEFLVHSNFKIVPLIANEIRWNKNARIVMEANRLVHEWRILLKNRFTLYGTRLRSQ